MRTAFIDELGILAEADPRIWLVTGDLGFSVLDAFAERFPDRFVNAGVAEQNMMGVASGLARMGAHVFVYSIANFPTFRCLEQIRNDVCYPGLGVTIVSVGSGFSYGSHGSTHHAIEDLAVMRALPNIVVVSPGDPTEARFATRALAERDGPSYLRLGKAGEATVASAVDGRFELGSMRSIRNGTDVTLIATGSILTVAVAAADELEQDGLSVRVLSAHTLRPFDGATLLRALSETAGVVTVEEHRLIGGLRSTAGEVLVDAVSWPSGRIISLGVPSDTTMGTGDQAYLRNIAGLGTGAIVQAARRLVSGAPRS
jgi:transketolase